MTGEKRIMQVLDQTGHTSVTWDAANQDEVAAARETFNTMTGKGYTAFRVDRRGNQSTQIREFDPSAEEMVLVPQLKGG